MASKDLTPRQQRFVAECIVLGNPEEAAIRAGYIPRTASITAKRLLALEPVAEAVEGGQKDCVAHDTVTRQWIVARRKDVAVRCMQAEPVKAVRGKGEGQDPAQYKFDAANANRALNLLGKYLHMFSERVEHQVSVHENALDELE